MKPFIFQFMEQPSEEALDYALVSYDPSLNLSIDKRTGIPAIETITMETTTFTKTQGEGVDSDRDGLSSLAVTETVTYVNNELKATLN